MRQAAAVLLAAALLAGCSVGTPTRPGPSPAPTADPRSQPVTAARAFVQAFFTRSWRDPSATAYLDRAKPYTTDDYHDELRESTSGGGGLAWQHYVHTQSVTAPDIRDAAPVHDEDPKPDQATIVVTVDVTTSNATDGNTTQPYTLTLATLRSRYHWRVDRMRF